MFLGYLLRLLMLGEPLLKPAQPSPSRLFAYELASNLVFDVYVAALVALFFAGTFLVLYKRRRSESGSLLYIIGFLLIFCSYNLQRVAEIGRLLNRSVGPSSQRRWFWEGWMQGGDSKGAASLLSRIRSLGSIMEARLHSTSKHVLVMPGLTEPGATRLRSEGLCDASVQQNPKTEVVLSACMDDPQSTAELEAGTEAEYPKQSLPAKTGRMERREALLKDLLRLFESKVATDEKLKRRVAGLRSTQRQVEAAMDEFSKAFRKFMDDSGKIQKEMVAFNASTRYLDIVFGELKTEIDKYFSNLPDTAIRRDVSTYLSTLIRNYHVPGEENWSAGDVAPILRYKDYVMFFLVVLVVLSLLLFVASLVRLDAAVAVLRPVVSMCLIVAVVFNAVLLLNGQMLDRNCKSGAVKGCSFTQTLSTSGDRQSGTSRRSGLNGSLERMLLETSRVSERLGCYVRDVASEKVGVKVSAFYNLFGKILFVQDDFCHLTSGKVNKDAFYDNIRIMSRALESVTVLLNGSRHVELVDIHAAEAGFAFWLRATRESIVGTVRNVTEVNPKSQNAMSTEWCVDALQSVCEARDEIDALFTLMFFGGPVFLALLQM